MIHVWYGLGMVGAYLIGTIAGRRLPLSCDINFPIILAIVFWVAYVAIASGFIFGYYS